MLWELSSDTLCRRLKSTFYRDDIWKFEADVCGAWSVRQGAERVDGDAGCGAHAGHCDVSADQPDGWDTGLGVHARCDTHCHDARAIVFGFCLGSALASK